MTEPDPGAEAGADEEWVAAEVVAKVLVPVRIQTWFRVFRAMFMNTRAKNFWNAKRLLKKRLAGLKNG